VATISEDYVSFEVAKLLKDKGFNEPTIGTYNIESKNPILVERPIRAIHCEAIISAPTLQMAMKWLREVHDIKIMIRPYVDGTYSYEILNGFWYVNFDSYEDAAEAAIKYCLKNLI